MASNFGLVKGRTSVFATEEVTEGVYVAPASAADAVEVLDDFAGFEYTREEITRNVLSDTIESEASRPGLPSVAGDVPVEFKAAAVEGDAPRSGKLYKALLGGVRQITSSSTTKASGNTVTELQVEDADVTKYQKNDILLVKVPGNWQVRPVLSVDATPGAAKVVLAIALDAVANSVVIGEMTKYFHQDAAKTLSFTSYNGGEIEDQARGVRAISAELSDWTTGQIPKWSFALEGLDLGRSVDTPDFPTDFSGEPQPPVALEACVWLNGIETDYPELSLSIENTKSDILSACAPSGKVGSRFTELAVTGSINPYMQDDNTDRFNSFNQNDDLSVFAYAFNPGVGAGEKINIVAIWLPQTKITQLATGDQDGILVDQIDFKSYRKSGGDSVFLGFI
jgi:hypothetical protein